MSTEPPPNEAPHPAEVEDVEVPIPAPVERRAVRAETAPKPPHSLEAEREVLAAIVVDNACTERVVATPLEPRDFFVARHQVIFAAMISLAREGAAIDVVTLRQALVDAGVYEQLGGMRALSELLDRLGTVAHVEHYARIVRDKARVRHVLEAGLALQAKALEDGDADELVAHVQASMAGLVAHIARPVEPLVLDSVAERVAKGAPNMLEDVPPDAPVLLRNPDGSPFMLDGRTGVLEAPGGTGKSWLVIQLAVAVACGTPWLETYQCSRKGRVLLALAEEQHDEIWRRVWRVSKHLGLDAYQRSEVARYLVPLALEGEDVAFLRKSPDGNITQTAWFARLQDAMSRHSWRLGILDPLSFFGGPEVEADPYIATTLIRCVAQLTKSPGNPAMVVSAHSRKKQQGLAMTLDASNTRGSSAIVDGARWVCSMGKRSDAIIALKATKTNYTVGGDELLLTRGKGGVLRPATDDEIAADIETRKDAKAKARRGEA